jgi:hypothetical protein
LQTRTDALGAGNDALAVSRSGTAVTNLSFGNTTNNPTYTFSGSGQTTHNGVVLINTVASNALVIDSTNASGPYTTFRRSGTPFADMGDGAQLGGGFTLDYFGIGARAGFGIQMSANGATSPTWQLNTSNNVVQTGTLTVNGTGTSAVAGLLRLGDTVASGDRLVLFNNVARSSSNLEHYFNYAPTQLDIYSYDGASTALGTVRFRQTQLQLANGSAGTPVLSFTSDTNTGLYGDGADGLFFAEGGTGFRIGYRAVPRSTTATTLAIGDVGKCVAITAAINIPISTFAAGDCITIYNDSAGALNLTISAGTLRLAGTTTTGTRSIAVRGLCTIWFNTGGATPEVIASGNVT